MKNKAGFTNCLVICPVLLSTSISQIMRRTGEFPKYATSPAFSMTSHQILMNGMFYVCHLLTRYWKNIVTACERLVFAYLLLILYLSLPSHTKNTIINTFQLMIKFCRWCGVRKLVSIPDLTFVALLETSCLRLHQCNQENTPDKHST